MPVIYWPNSSQVQFLFIWLRMLQNQCHAGLPRIGSYRRLRIWCWAGLWYRGVDWVLSVMYLALGTSESNKSYLCKFRPTLDKCTPSDFKCLVQNCTRKRQTFKNRGITCSRNLYPAISFYVAALVIFQHSFFWKRITEFGLRTQHTLTLWRITEFNVLDNWTME